MAKTAVKHSCGKQPAKAPVKHSCGKQPAKAPKHQLVKSRSGRRRKGSGPIGAPQARAVRTPDGRVCFMNHNFTHNAITYVGARVRAARMRVRAARGRVRVARVRVRVARALAYVY